MGGMSRPISWANCRRTPVTRSSKSPPFRLSAKETNPNPSSMSMASTPKRFSSLSAAGEAAPAAPGAEAAADSPGLAALPSALRDASAAMAGRILRFLPMNQVTTARTRNGNIGNPGTNARNASIPERMTSARGYDVS